MHKGVSASDAFRIMEQVRKGRGLTDEDIKLMKQFDVPDWYIESCLRSNTCFRKPTLLPMLSLLIGRHI